MEGYSRLDGDRRQLRAELVIKEDMYTLEEFRCNFEMKEISDVLDYLEETFRDIPRVVKKHQTVRLLRALMVSLMLLERYRSFPISRSFDIETRLRLLVRRLLEFGETVEEFSQCMLLHKTANDFFEELFPREERIGGSIDSLLHWVDRESS